MFPALWVAIVATAFARQPPVRLDHISWDIDLASAALNIDAGETTIAVDGPWRLVQTLNGVRTWETPLPTQTRTLFFHRPPKGMSLLRRKASDSSWEGAKKLTHRPMGNEAAGTWSFDSTSLHLRRTVEAGPPPPGMLGMRFPEATERQDALRRISTDAEDFVIRSLQIGDTTRHGLYLVPGTTLRGTVTVPPDGQLRLEAVSVPPQAAPTTAPRDGQLLQVNVVPADGNPIEVWASRPPDQHPSRLHIDLTRWQDQEVQLVLSAPKDGVDETDAVFVGSPVLLQPNPNPPRIVVLFIDTLRQDALSLYGNPVETSPGIDAWARNATVFHQARSVAPWTLPTARSMFSGHAPEQWGRVSDLPTILGKNGWSTAFISGNIYLSSNFDMANHWSTHRCINWPQADVQVDRARDWLDQQVDTPAFLVLHLMDMHLPYTEPAEFRDRFAGPTPAPFTDDVFHRNQVAKWAPDMNDESRAWLRGRYHNNLAYIDSVVTPFLASLPPQSTVIVLSDHGEEFWDHGDFEHGHTLYEELVRVPLMVRGPGFPSAQIDAPASILDITATVLRAAGLEHDTDGTPLQDIAADPAAFAERAVAFGRPLYGQRRWGVVQNHLKYTTWKSTETVVDLAADPGETHNLLPDAADAVAWRALLSEALQTPVYVAWSLYPQRSSKSKDLTAVVTVPGGILHAWAAEDPTLMSEVTTTVSDGLATLRWTGNMRGTREAYIVPDGDALSMLKGASIEVSSGSASGSMPLPESTPPLDGRNHVLGRVRVGGRSITLQTSVVPLPPQEGVGIRGFNTEVEAELKALGYLDH